MRGRGNFQNNRGGRPPFRGRGGGRFRQDNRNNTSPQRQNNNSNRSTPNNTPNKTPNKTPDKPIQGKSPAINQNKPANQTPKTEIPPKTEKRERSRSPLTPPPTFKSPILTKPLPSKPLPKSSPSQNKEPAKETKSKDNRANNKNKNQQATSSQKANSDSDGVRYRGRPGEKKFSNRCRLFIANLNTTMTEEDVRALFVPYGELSESYFNKDKGFGFVRLDYRINAEDAKSSLDKKLVKGRNIQVRFATHASAIELHGLDQFASNEIIEQAMSQFGAVERAKIVCDERGKSRGYAIVEFEWKKNAQKVLDRFKDEMFVLGRLPKPVFAKPLVQQDDEDGILEENLTRIQGYEQEREFQPRFIPPDAFEFQLAQKWRDLYLEEQEKKASLDRELEELRYNLELEMESASRERDAMKIREELVRRQEELRLIEEEMQNKRQMAQMGRPNHGGPGGMMGNRNPQFDNRGPPRGQRGPDNQNFHQQNMNNAPQNHGRGPAPEIDLQRVGAALANAGIPGFGPRPGMNQGPRPMNQGPRPGMNQGPRPGMNQGPPQGNGILQPHQNMQPGMLPNPGPRGPPMGMRSPMMGPRPMRGGGPRRY